MTFNEKHNEWKEKNSNSLTKNFDKKRAEYRWKKNRAQIVADLSKDMAAYANQINKYNVAYKNRYAGRNFDFSDAYVPDSATWKAHSEKAKEQLGEKYNRIQSTLTEYSDYLDNDWVNSIKKSLDAQNSAVGKMVQTAQIDAEHWAQYADEDAYTNNYWKRLEDQYGHVRKAEDFEEYSKPKETKIVIQKDGAMLGGDPVYNYINNSAVDFSNSVPEYSWTDMDKKNASYRDYIEKIVSYSLAGFSYDDGRAYSYMTDDEIAIYNYLYAKEGKEKSEEYLEFIRELLNAERGKDEYEKMSGLEKAFYWIPAGLDQFGQGITQLFSAEKIPTTSTQYTSGLISEELHNDSPFVGWLYDAGTTVSNMLPSIAVGAIPGVGPALTAASVGASTAGNSYGWALDQGWSREEAAAYGILTGASEAALQSVLGGISKLSGASNVTAKLASKANAIDNALLRTAAKYGIRIGGEIVEEELQSFLEPAFRTIITGEDYDAPTIEEIIETAVVTAISTGAINSSTDLISNAVAKNKYGQYATDIAANTLKLNPNDKLASNVLEGEVKNISGEKINTLLERNVEYRSTLNKNDIKQALVDKGLSEKDAASHSRWLAEAAEGKTFTRNQRKILNENEEVTDVWRDMGASGNTRKVNTGKIKDGAFEVVEKKVNENIQRVNKRTEDTNYIEAVASGKITQEQFNAHKKAKDSAYKLAYEMGKGGLSADYVKNSGGLSALTAEERKVAYESGIEDSINERVRQFTATDTDPQGVAMIRSLPDAVGITTEEADTLISKMPSDISPEAYAFGVETAIRNGKMGIPYETTSKNAFASAIDEQTRKYAYDLGIEQGKAEASVNQENVSVKKRTIKAHGRLFCEGNAANTLTKRQRVSKVALERIAHGLGIDIYLFESRLENGKRVYDTDRGTVELAPNGMYYGKDGSIHIDINAGKDGEGVMLFTAAHELTHFIKEWSPQKYDEFARFLLDEYGKKGVDIEELIQAQIDKADGNLTKEEALEEVVADTCETMLTDSNAIEKIARLKAQDETLWGKIKEFITNLVAKIKSVYDGLSPNSLEAQYVREMVDVAEQLQEMWTSALLDASASFDKAEPTSYNKAVGDLTVKDNGEDIAEADLQVKFSVRDKNKDEKFTTAGIHWGLDYGIMTEAEANLVWVAITDINKRNYKYPRTAAGEHIISTDKALFFVNTDYNDPLVSRIIRFDESYQLNNNFAKEKIIDAERKNNTDGAHRNSKGRQRDEAGGEAGYREALRALENIFGEGYITQYDAATYYADAWQDGRRKGTYSRGNTQKTKPRVNYTFEDDVDYSLRAQDGGFSNRTLLANALESTVQNEQESKRLKEYKAKIEAMSKEQANLGAMRKELKELSFAPGKRNEAQRNRIKQLSNDIVKATNNINTYDKSLLKLESNSMLQEVLKRECIKARKDASAKAKASMKAQAEKRYALYEGEIAELKATNKEKLKEAREEKDQEVAALKAHNKEVSRRATERREKTKMRNKISKVLNEIQTNLFKNTKEHHVPKDLKKVVASALSAINTDAVNAEVRLNGFTDEYGVFHEGINQQIEKAEARLRKAESDVANATATEIDKALAGMHKIEQEIERLEERKTELLGKDDVMKRHLEDLRQALHKIASAPKGGFEGQISENAKAITERVADLIDDVGDTPIRLMTMSQLEKTYKVYKMIATTIRDANKVFREGKAEDLRENATAVMDEEGILPRVKGERASIIDKVRDFSWNEMTPVYAFRRLGSPTLEKFYWDFIKAQRTYAKDADEARVFKEQAKKKYGYDNWDMDKTYQFELVDGTTFETTLKHMMSIYAYSKRSQALSHMSDGGFFYNDKSTFRKTRKGLVELRMSNEESYKIGQPVLDKIIDSMNRLDKNIIKYVEEMQSYLSTEMAKKGNEASTILWGVDLFGEESYFPLRSVKDFIKKETEPVVSASLKNDGMTKETKPGASNPIVLEAFDEVWSNHVERMSQYHAYVVPLENLNKVKNYGTWLQDKTKSVSRVIQARHGVAAIDYLNNFINDMNGSMATSGAQAPTVALFSRFKKTAVGASLSTVVQQESAIYRAMSIISPKYFRVESPITSTDSTTKAYADMRKYAPITIIKEIGGFEIGSGKGVSRWLNEGSEKGIEKAFKKIDDVSMAGAAWADKHGWITIWKACERELRAKHPQMDTNSDAFKTKVGERFEEIIVLTQVYDSPLSRSGYMRSKSDIVKMATSFMGEPTLSLNIMYDAVLQAKRGAIGKRQAVKNIAYTTVSIIMAKAAASAIYALRDDDDDKSYAEKYIESLTEGLVGNYLLTGDLNPLTMLPFANDIISLLEGWDVERSDMAVFADLINGIGKLFDDGELTWKKVENSIGAIANFFGIPGKNALRTVREIYNLFKNIFDKEAASASELADAFTAGLTSTTVNQSQKIYSAVMRNDQEQLKELKSGYKDETAYYSALAKALRENDERITQAAEAKLSGNLDEMQDIFKEIKAEGDFAPEIIVDAINSEYKKLTFDTEASEETAENDTVEKEVSVYGVSDVNVAFENGNTEQAKEVINEILDVKVKNYLADPDYLDKHGKLTQKALEQQAGKDAKQSLKSSLSAYWKPLYVEAYKAKDAEEMKRIRFILRDSGLYGSANDIIDIVKKWIS